MSDPDYYSFFYELAAQMGLGARTESPEWVWRNVMFPKLKVLILEEDNATMKERAKFKPQGALRIDGKLTKIYSREDA